MKKKKMSRRSCIVINLRSAVTIVLMFICSGIRNSETASGNQMMTNDNVKNESTFKNNYNNIHDIASINNNNNAVIPLTISKSLNDTNTFCAGHNDDMLCANLEYPCIRCNYNYSCHYGNDLNVTCSVSENVQCLGDRKFQRIMNCRYCYQTELWQQSCVMRGNCNYINEPHYRTNCTVFPKVLCLGNRSFPRNMRCNWTQGYRWSTALIISLTLGGFGADRFYLGHWQEGIGKLFSFGGLGVWTIIDVLLISLHYLGPADGSLYI